MQTLFSFIPFSARTHHRRVSDYVLNMARKKGLAGSSVFTIFDLGKKGSLISRILSGHPYQQLEMLEIADTNFHDLPKTEVSFWVVPEEKTTWGILEFYTDLRKLKLLEKLLHSAREEKLPGGTIVIGERGFGRRKIIYNALNEVNMDKLPAKLILAGPRTSLEEFLRSHNKFLGEMTYVFQNAYQPDENINDIQLVCFFASQNDLEKFPKKPNLYCLYGLEGFGRSKNLRRSRLFRRGSPLPVIIYGIFDPEQTEEIIALVPNIVCLKQKLLNI